MGETRPHWSTRTKLTITLLLLGFAIYLLYRFSAAIQPLILAVVLAYILWPMTNWFEKRLKIRRGLATMLSYTAALAILAVIPLVVIPPLNAQSKSLNVDIQRILTEIEAVVTGKYVIAGRTIDTQAIFQGTIGSVQGIIEPFLGQTLGIAIEAISSLVWVVFVLVVSIYLVKDAQSLHQWLEKITPPDYKEDFTRLRSEINKIWSAFFRGQLVLALVVAVIFTIVGLAIGMPFALAMGILAGLLEFLPSIGHGIWLLIASSLAFFVGSTWLPIPNWAFTLLVIGMHIFYQQFDLNYLIPRIIGRRVKLHPLVVILGIVTGALLAGVLGILLAAPTIASARVIGGYIYANLFDQEPFPDTVALSLPPPDPHWWRLPRQSQSRDKQESL